MLVYAGILALILAALFLVYKFLKKFFLFALNSAIGLFALFGFNYLLREDVAINIWSVIITAFSGIFGFIFILIAHYMGWAF